MVTRHYRMPSCNRRANRRILRALEDAGELLAGHQTLFSGGRWAYGVETSSVVFDNTERYAQLTIRAPDERQLDTARDRIVSSLDKEFSPLYTFRGLPEIRAEA